MTERRPMSAALRISDLRPEELAFIKAGTPQPKVVEPVVETGTPPTPAADKATEISHTEPAAVPKPEPSEKVRPSKPKMNREPEPEPLAHRINLSIRVPVEIPEGLLRASTDRKLKRIKPNTHQEMAAEAITEWLQRHGYLQGPGSRKD